MKNCPKRWFAVKKKSGNEVAGEKGQTRVQQILLVQQNETGNEFGQKKIKI